MNEDQLMFISIILIILGLISLAFFSYLKNDEIDIPFKLIDDTYLSKNVEIKGDVLEILDFNQTKIITIEFLDRMNLNIFGQEGGLDIDLNDTLIVHGMIEKYNDEFYIVPNLVLKENK